MNLSCLLKSCTKMLHFTRLVSVVVCTSSIPFSLSSPSPLSSPSFLYLPPHPLSYTSFPSYAAFSAHTICEEIVKLNSLNLHEIKEKLVEVRIYMVAMTISVFFSCYCSFGFLWAQRAEKWICHRYGIA